MSLLEEARDEVQQYLTRRHFFKTCGLSLGAVALGSLMGCASHSTETIPQAGLPHRVPRAKRIIFLHMAGAPSQLELFDYKPTLHSLDGQDCPPSLLAGKRFAFIVGVPRMLGPQASFRQYGASGAWVSDLLPHFTQVVDDVAFLKAVYTDEFNHLCKVGLARPTRRDPSASLGMTRRNIGGSLEPFFQSDR